MATFEQPSLPLVDERGAAFARLTARIVDALNDAVDRRQSEGVSRVDLAHKLGWHKSALSRLLNGTTRNMTVKSISDILWATDFEPKEFEAEPLEEVCPNSPLFDNSSKASRYYMYVSLDIDDQEHHFGSTNVVSETSKVIAR